MTREALEPYLNGFALFLLIALLIGFVYLLIYIHDIPYKIAKKRDHPHAEALEAAGWVSLFLMHAIWPFLWIWAFWYRKDQADKGAIKVQQVTPIDSDAEKLYLKKIADLESKIIEMEEGNNIAKGKKKES